MVNTLVRDNNVGINLQGGATADISGSKFLGNISNGILVQSTASTTTTGVISDTVVTGGGTGIEAFSSGTSGSARINMVRSTVTNTTEGIATSGTAGTASVTLSDSMVTGNATGYFKGSGGTLTSLGNNTITDNVTNTGGPIPTISLQ